MDARSEHEQLEAIREWWVKHGKIAALAALLVLGGAAGVRLWTGYQDAGSEAASADYDRLLRQMQQGTPDQALQTGARIIEDHESSTYAVYAAMLMAKLEVEKADVVSAKRHLQWALDHADGDGLRHVIRLRLARLLLDEGKAREALALLPNDITGAFAGAYAAVRGDAYLAQGQLAQAQSAFKQALSDPNTAPDQRETLQMKLDNIAQPGQGAAEASS